jgi:hypothetical protein
MTIKRIALGFLVVGPLAALFSLAGANVGAADSLSPTNTLAGSWRETVTFPPEVPRPPLKSLSTFHKDGTLTISDHGSVTTVPGPPGTPPPSVFTAGHGVWKNLGKRTFAYTQFELISDLSGNFVGHLKVRGLITLSKSGDEWTGNSFAEIFDPDGNLVLSVPVTNVAQRIRLELPPP